MLLLLAPRGKSARVVEQRLSLLAQDLALALVARRVRALLLRLLLRLLRSLCWRRHAQLRVVRRAPSRGNVHSVLALLRRRRRLSPLMLLLLLVLPCTDDLSVATIARWRRQRRARNAAHARSRQERLLGQRSSREGRVWRCTTTTTNNTAVSGHQHLLPLLGQRHRQRGIDDAERSVLLLLLLLLERG